MDQKKHWEKVYSEKQLPEVSWYQSTPTVSWHLIQELGIKKDAAIIDIGGGDSLFVDFLLAQGFTNITVLDISAQAIGRAQRRLGQQADKITWIVCDILDFSPKQKFDLWHDRAVLHFLTKPADVEKYLQVSYRQTNTGGKIIISTFSETGPEKCSGLEVKRYSETALSRLFSGIFTKIKCLAEDHLTPWGKSQHFMYCAFAA